MARATSAAADALPVSMSACAYNRRVSKSCGSMRLKASASVISLSNSRRSRSSFRSLRASLTSWAEYASSSVSASASARRFSSSRGVRSGIRERSLLEVVVRIHTEIGNLADVVCIAEIERAGPLEPGQARFRAERIEPIQPAFQEDGELRLL